MEGCAGEKHETIGRGIGEKKYRKSLRSRIRRGESQCESPEKLREER